LLMPYLYCYLLLL
ncbi:putative membrane protein, partial [Escherichia coli 96.0932]